MRSIRTKNGSCTNGRRAERSCVRGVGPGGGSSGLGVAASGGWWWCHGGDDSLLARSLNDSGENEVIRTKKNETRTKGRHVERSCVLGGQLSGTRSQWWVVVTCRSLELRSTGRPEQRVRVGPNGAQRTRCSSCLGMAGVRLSW